MSRYVVIIEPTATGYSAYVPDVDGCVTTGRTHAEIVLRMQEALTGHLELMRESGLRIPAPASDAAFVEIPD